MQSPCATDGPLRFEFLFKWSVSYRVLVSVIFFLDNRSPRKDTEKKETAISLLLHLLFTWNFFAFLYRVSKLKWTFLIIDYQQMETAFSEFNILVFHRIREVSIPEPIYTAWKSIHKTGRVMFKTLKARKKCPNCWNVPCNIQKLFRHLTKAQTEQIENFLCLFLSRQLN